MTKRGSRQATARTSLCLLVTLVVVCVTSGITVGAHKLPLPGPLQPNLFNDPADEAENIMLINRLKQLMDQKHRVVEQENEISDEQIAIQAILEAKARERERTMEQSPADYPIGEPESEPEALPVPAAMIHDQQHQNKRQGMNAVSYMSLCHFKICNMGRKRQSK